MNDPVNGLRPSDIANLVAQRAPSKKLNTGDAGAFEAALAAESTRSFAAGKFARRLPTGAAAASWARWRPPAEALGMVPPASGAINPDGTSSVSSAGLNRALSSSAPGVVGDVFAVADTAGEALVNLAGNQLGAPFSEGEADPDSGFDAPGLIQHAFGELGIRLPRSHDDQAKIGVAVASLAEARPGDIVAFGEPVDHVGLYVGDGKLLHASRVGEVVAVEEIDRPIVAIRRVLSGNNVGPAVLRTAGTAAPSGLGVLPSEITPETRGDMTMAPAISAEHSGPISNVPYAELFSAAGAEWNVDPALLAAVAQVESGFDPTAVSPAGAQGLMQFMPATANEMDVDPWDPASAIDGAAQYLRTSLSQFNEVDHALASYNAGRGAVRRYGGVPPFPETEDYVRKVLDVWRST